MGISPSGPSHDAFYNCRIISSMYLEIVAPPCGWAATVQQPNAGLAAASRSLHHHSAIGRQLSRVERGVYASSIPLELEPRQYEA
jgi:hypothetical protein